MATRKKDLETREAESRLTNVHPWFVSLVDYGANWGGKNHGFVLRSASQMAKRVPTADASNEDKRKALEERAASYGIAARDDASLSYPAGDPTTETLYGDPTNLAYPLGRDDNEPDADRIRNALSRFKQNADAYSDETSRGRVYARIVRAAIAAGIAVSFDASDPVDALLPADLRNALAKADGPKPTADAGTWQIQSVVLDNTQFTREQAIAWLKDHDFAADNLDETGTSWRARQYDPAYFAEFRYGELKDGVSVVYGMVKAAEAVGKAEADVDAEIAIGAALAALPQRVALRAEQRAQAAAAEAAALKMVADALAQRAPAAPGDSLDAAAALHATVKASTARVRELEGALAAKAAEVQAMQRQVTAAVAKAGRLERPAPALASLAEVVGNNDGGGQPHRHPIRYTRRAAPQEE